MAQPKQSAKVLQSSKFNKKVFLLFLVMFGLIGGWTLLKSQASIPKNPTVLFSDVSDINASSGSAGYMLVNDTLNYHTISVAKIAVNGMLSFSGKGGGTTGKTAAKEVCYMLRADKTATNVQLLGTNGGVVQRIIQPWPYAAEPRPYEYECVGEGSPPNKSVPEIHVLKGGPVFFYKKLQIITYYY